MLVAVLVLSGFGGVARAERSREAFEADIETELRAIDPEAVELLQRAEAARQAGDLDNARTLYTELHDRVPGFVHATRRLCSVESALGHRDAALALCREALAASAAPENQIAMADALMASSSGTAPVRDLAEADKLVSAALAQDPDSVYGYVLACELAVERYRMPMLATCSQRLRELAPQQVGTWWFSALDATDRGDWDAAHEYLERAHELGLPDDMYESLDKIIREHMPASHEWIKRVALGIFGWAVMMLLLIVVGSILSRRTLRAADAITGADAREPVHPTGASLRKIYKVLLQVSCVVYFLSLPLVLVLVVLVGGGILYGFWAVGHIPIKLAAIVAGLTVLTVVAIVRSMWVRGRDVDPGTRLDLAEHPQLRAVLEEVADKVGTRCVDSVYLTPGTDIAVFERGGVMSQLRGRSERCLVLGIAVLDGMSLPAFKSILAHEYGHFSNRDTASGGLALAVRRSLESMGSRLVQSGSAAWYNPAWLFLQVFYRVFLRISHGASRLQEILADRWAVLSYGAGSFESGMRHVIASSVRFDAHVDRVIHEVLETETPLRNLYRHEPESAVDEDEIEAAIEAVTDAEPSAYDSHPRPADRIRWAHAMHASEPAEAASDTRDAASLLGDHDTLEVLMTEEVRTNIAMRYDVVVP